MLSDIKLASSSSDARLALHGIRKRYPAIVANDGIDMTVKAGQIHAVLGENGAGKSTLMKIIYGVVQPDAGEIRWEADPIVISTPAQARRLGIGMVFQHFSLFETLTAVENIALGMPGRSDLAALSSQIVALSDRMVSRSIRSARSTRCRLASANASRSSARCCKIRGC